MQFSQLLELVGPSESKFLCKFVPLVLVPHTLYAGTFMLELMQSYLQFCYD